MLIENPWRELVSKAAQYLELGQKTHYLHREDRDYPWEFVSSISEGSSHRLDISTSVSITAEHPCGLTFRWSFDIEKRSANGLGYYDIDTASIEEVLKRIPAKAASQFKSYFARYIEALGKNAKQYEAIAASERRIIADLERLEQ